MGKKGSTQAAQQTDIEDATKTAAANEGGGDAAEKPKKEPKRPQAERETFTFHQMPEKDAKVAPQLIGTLNALQELGGKASRKDLVQKMHEHVTSKQDMSRILQFYKKQMVDEGYVTTDIADK